MFEQEFFFPRKPAKPLQGCRLYLALVDIPTDQGCVCPLKSALTLQPQLQKILHEASCYGLQERRHTNTGAILCL